MHQALFSPLQVLPTATACCLCSELWYHLGHAFLGLENTVEAANEFPHADSQSQTTPARL